MYLLYADDSGVTSDPNVYNKELRDGGLVKVKTQRPVGIRLSAFFI